MPAAKAAPGEGAGTGPRSGVGAAQLAGAGSESSPGRRGGGSASSDTHVQLVSLTKLYGTAPAVSDVNLSVPRGSFTTLLGPSGCGKTTVLRMIAGFVDPSGGAVKINGVDQVGRPPNLRGVVGQPAKGGVGMVFQDYALFPHMSVRANVEYGLRMQKLPKTQRAERVDRVLNLLDLSALGGRYPHELSGGQQQRVALGRVMVLEPEVLLMDEPLSNLDAKLRLRLRAELKTLQRQLGITTVYVTHDQEEALSLSDLLVVMNEGQVQQVGSPQHVYRNPANRFVAEFVGQANLLTVETRDVSGGGLSGVAAGRLVEMRLPDSRAPEPRTRGLAMVRPEHVLLNPAATSAVWTAEARVLSHGFFGAFQRYWLEVQEQSESWLVDVGQSAESDTAAVMDVGTVVTVGLTAGAACWLW